LFFQEDLEAENEMVDDKTSFPGPPGGDCIWAAARATKKEHRRDR
jgi:hypothetical protein